MTDDEFMQVETIFREQLEAFIKACEIVGFVAKDRLDDILFDAGIEG